MIRAGISLLLDAAVADGLNWAQPLLLLLLVVVVVAVAVERMQIIDDDLYYRDHNLSTPLIRYGLAFA